MDSEPAESREVEASVSYARVLPRMDFQTPVLDLTRVRSNMNS